MKHSKRFWSDLFYVPKYEKVSDKAFLRMMLSSVFGILFCGICLAGLTWAWFTSSISSTANTITAAKFTVGISVIQEGSATPLSPTEENGKYTYSLSAGTKYAVTITASGDAEKYGGYCSVTYLRETPYHTVQLYPGSNEDKIHSATFTVSASDSSSLIIVPQWGTYAKPDDEELIGDDINTLPIQSLSVLEAETEETQTYHLTKSEQSYTVQQGDTLSEIANRYGTTADLLSAYNNIESTAEIKAGDTLKIPPASYKITEPVTAQSETAESTASEPPITEEPAAETTGSINVEP